MTRFARKGGVVEKREAKKKKEAATEWTEMFESTNQTEDPEANKRKHEAILEKKIQEDPVVKKPATMSRETLLRMYGEFIDKEVLADLDDMFAKKKLTEEEYADALIREGRSNRRRLDRQLEREASRVCFKCRKAGHSVEQCPEVTNDCQQGTGICYKCGSTEHSVNKCKVRVEPGKYPYATCYICKEQGHLSKQCPDNPRGLYPNGGGCRSCGSVEHYYRDCPEVQKKNLMAETKTLKKFSPNDILEDISDDELKNRPKPNPIRKNKVVIFK